MSHDPRGPASRALGTAPIRYGFQLFGTPGFNIHFGSCWNGPETFYLVDREDCAGKLSPLLSEFVYIYIRVNIHVVITTLGLDLLRLSLTIV